MKILVDLVSKDNLDNKYIDGVILHLKDYSVDGKYFYTKEEIKDIVDKYKDKEFFVCINKNLFNDEVEDIKSTLLYLDKINIKGIFFYDLAVLELKRKLNLKVDLVWNQTFMVNNYRTCDYYYSKGVKYALLGKELTIDEVIEIIKSSKISSIVEVISKPTIAFSYRSLVENYYKDLGKKASNELDVHEDISDLDIKLEESDKGTNFILDKIINGTGIIKDLYDVNCSYILIREDGINNFKELIKDTRNYIDNGCSDDNYIDKYKTLGDYTNFFYKKTIYRVKKD